MSSIFLLRHQAAGYVIEHPFASQPTAEQLAPILTMLDARHGVNHRKTGEPHWHRVEEVKLLGPGDMPAVEVPAASPSQASASGEFAGLEMTGHGTVRNPK